MGLLAARVRAVPMMLAPVENGLAMKVTITPSLAHPLRGSILTP
jgi:hypothetical protein